MICYLLYLSLLVLLRDHWSNISHNLTHRSNIDVLFPVKRDCVKQFLPFFAFHLRKFALRTLLHGFHKRGFEVVMALKCEELWLITRL